MKDREKVLRWNLQEAEKEMNKPLDVGGMIVGGMMVTSWAYGILNERKNNLKKCQAELEEYLNQNKDDEKKRI
jgi:hypothetical protein